MTRTRRHLRRSIALQEWLSFALRGAGGHHGVFPVIPEESYFG